VPALIVAILYGEKGTGTLLILSQVILSVQLSFAVVPLLQFTGNKTKMEQFVNSRLLQTIAWGVAIIIILLNGVMLWKMVV